MKIARSFATVALVGALSCLPSLGSAQVMIGTSLSSIITLTVASHVAPEAEPQTVAFNWLANGAKAPSSDKTKAALSKYRAATGLGTWICSPAGFGKRSVCYAG